MKQSRISGRMRQLFSRLDLLLVPRLLGRGMVFLGATLALNATAETKPVDFLRDVRPILSSHCFKCHGPDETTRKGGLRLDIREEAVKPAKSGEYAIVPLDVEKSHLLERINTSDADDLMPPASAKHPLNEKQKEILRRWIAEGAEYQPHWAFVKPKQPVPPEGSRKEWARNAIDKFVLARLEKEGLEPSARADKYSLIRRVYLDLIGLPADPCSDVKLALPGVVHSTLNGAGNWSINWYSISAIRASISCRCFSIFGSGIE